MANTNICIDWQGHRNGHCLRFVRRDYGSTEHRQRRNNHREDGGHGRHHERDGNRHELGSEQQGVQNQCPVRLEHRWDQRGGRQRRHLPFFYGLPYRKDSLRPGRRDARYHLQVDLLGGRRLIASYRERKL